MSRHSPCFQKTTENIDAKIPVKIVPKTLTELSITSGSLILRCVHAMNYRFKDPYRKHLILSPDAHCDY